MITCIIHGIGHAFGYYDYDLEREMVDAYPSREAAAIFICGYVRMALQSGMLYTTSEKGEGYIAVDPLSDSTSYHLIRASRDCVVLVLHNHPSLSAFSLSDIQFLLKYETVKLMVVVTNLGSVSYLVKNGKYDFEKAVILLNEAIDLNNKAKNIKDLQEEADYFLKNCYNVGINYENR